MVYRAMHGARPPAVPLVVLDALGRAPLGMGHILPAVHRGQVGANLDGFAYEFGTIFMI